MNVDIWITVKDGGDRPYVSTTPPTRERLRALEQQDCVVYKATIRIPGWRTESTELGQITRAQIVTVDMAAVERGMLERADVEKFHE